MGALKGVVPGKYPNVVGEFLTHADNPRVVGTAESEARFEDSWGRRARGLGIRLFGGEFLLRLFPDDGVASVAQSLVRWRWPPAECRHAPISRLVLS